MDEITLHDTLVKPLGFTRRMSMLWLGENFIHQQLMM
jgi:hypothetical protein